MVVQFFISSVVVCVSDVAELFFNLAFFAKLKKAGVEARRIAVFYFFKKPQCDTPKRIVLIKLGIIAAILYKVVSIKLKIGYFCSGF